MKTLKDSLNYEQFLERDTECYFLICTGKFENEFYPESGIGLLYIVSDD